MIRIAGVLVVGLMLVPVGQGVEVDPMIRELRMGEIVVEAGAGVEVQVEQVRHEFWFGAAISSSPFGRWMNAEDVRRYKETFLANFNSAVTENALKWHAMESKRGQVDYSIVDGILAWTESNDIPLRGHNIFWGIPGRVQPWLKELGDDELRAVLKDRATTIAERYKGRFAEYDLNNEMIHANYYEQRLGAGITKEMVDWVKAADPGAVLYLNDYDILTGKRLDDYLKQIRGLQEQGVAIGGVGVQGHLHGDSFDPKALKEALDALAKTGLPVRITEFNIPGQRSSVYGKRDAKLTDEQEQAKAEALVEYYRICFAHPAVEGILMWGFWEGANWIPQSSLYRRDWTPTPAATAYHDLIYKEWWTSEKAKTDSTGKVAIPAFLGKHKVTVNGQSKTVHLTKSQKTLVISVK